MSLKKSISGALVALSILSSGCGQIQGNTPIMENKATPDLFAASETNYQIDDLNNSGFSLKAKRLNPGDPVPGRFIVKFKKNAKDTDILTKLKATKLGDINKTEKIQVISEAIGSNIMNKLKNDSSIEYIEQDVVVGLSAYYNLLIKINMYGFIYKYSYSLPENSYFNLVIN